MAQFSENDINEAKRRVWEMQNRANRLFEERQGTPPPQAGNNRKDSKKNEPKAQSEVKETDEQTDGKDDKSFLIILALILILSREGADNTLILALLYLLL